VQPQQRGRNVHGARGQKQESTERRNGQGRFGRLALVAVLRFGLLGCRTSQPCCHLGHVTAELESRTGQTLGPFVCPGETAIPPGIELSDGYTEDEAVAVALWNNAAYQEVLTQLGISRAQLLDAGLLTDPPFQIFFPLGPKQLEFTVFQAIDALWLRSIRVRAAELDLARVAEQMVQNGLDLIRDVRVAHAQLLFAQGRSELAAEAERLRTDIADLARKRLAAGDISELEATSSQVEAIGAKADSARFRQDVILVQNRLRNLLGLAFHEDELVLRPVAIDSFDGGWSVPSGISPPKSSHQTCQTKLDKALVAVASSLPALPKQSASELVDEALVVRPDLRAAEKLVESASRRTQLARRQFMNVDAIYDANSNGTDGFESGPGLRFTIPIFNRNQGRIAIADAQLQQAMRTYVTVRDRIVVEMQTSYTQAEQASENLETVQQEILPALKSAVDLARKNYLDGGTSYFLVLQTTGQFLDARARELELQADVRRAVAELALTQATFLLL
jgi:cobalt-zinc-cadmium efflux system outer membrane protein